ncbi:MAG TPA: heme-copper oxidase subunit III [Candidatus Baltobacteraceae bacterium]|nr:heme-copper oxidase subunit III [Candidatus Baltobacteraceae bacterium]
MSTIPAALPPTVWTPPARGRVGMYCLICAEAAIFTILVVAYLFYIGKSVTGPAPRDVLDVPIFYTVCLLSSSLVIHLAERELEHGRLASFKALWFLTFALGATFLLGTALEWRRLIARGLTISTNLFGTTYYSLVGLHALHVTVGLVGFIVVMILALASKVTGEHAPRIGIFSLYWHFVDAVWVVVFTVVYIIGR